MIELLNFWNSYRAEVLQVYRYSRNQIFIGFCDGQAYLRHSGRKMPTRVKTAALIFSSRFFWVLRPSIKINHLIFILLAINKIAWD